MFFTDQCQVYKTRLSEFDDTKASALGDYLPAKLAMDAGENVVYAVLPGPDYAGALLFFFENGKAARVDLTAYQTTSNRRKLTGAYSDKSPLACIRKLDADGELAVYSSERRCLIFHTALLAPQDHPYHPGGGGDEPEAQVPSGDGEAPGGDGHRQLQPLPGAEHPRRRRPGAGGGCGGTAAGPAGLTEQRGGVHGPESEELWDHRPGLCDLRLAFDWFVAPNQIAMGGVTGLAQIVNALLPVLPVGVMTIAINVPLFLAGWRLLGSRMLVTSLFATAVSSLAIDAIAAIHTFAPMEPLLAALYGGAAMGVGLGLVFSQGATTGGTDIIGKLMKRKFPGCPRGSW